MKKVLFTFILGLLISVTNIQAQWTQIGQNIDGDQHNLNFGWTTSLNSDGTIVAACALNYSSPSNADIGQVRIYKNVSEGWTQMGQYLTGGEVEWGQFGSSISLSADGNTVAIGAYYYNAHIFKFVDGSWTEIGTGIGDASGSDGYVVSLSADGTIVAVGGYSGNVSIYKNVNGVWTQIGDVITGEEKPDDFSLSLSADGTIVAIGNPYKNVNGTNSGQVRIFKNISDTWTLIGTLDGKAKDDKFGISVDLNSDGDIVAIGAPYNDDNGTDSGQVQVFKNNNGTWTQIGTNINGEATHDGCGRSVSMSADGSIIAIGIYLSDSNGTNSGQVRVFKNNDGVWTQIDSSIDGEAAYDENGHSVSLSADASIVAVGAAWNDNATYADSGRVRVYKNEALNISELKEAGISIYPNPSAGIFNIKNAKDYDITITDITGKVIYRTTATANEQVHLQQSGVYIVNFKSQTKNFSSKIIVK